MSVCKIIRINLTSIDSRNSESARILRVSEGNRIIKRDVIRSPRGYYKGVGRVANEI